MNSDEICDVRIGFTPSVTKVVLLLILTSILFLFRDSFYSSRMPREVLIYIYSLFLGIAFFVLMVRLILLNWRVRIDSKTLHVRRTWGWEKYQLSHFEVNEEWKRRLTDPTAASHWLADRSSFKLNFIGGRTVQFYPILYLSEDELKCALLKVLVPQVPESTLQVEAIVAAWMEYQNSAAGRSKFREYLANVVPALLVLSLMFIGFGAGGFLSFVTTDRIGIAVTIGVLVFSQVVGYSARRIFSVEGSLRKYLGYVIKAVAGLNFVLGMCMAALMNPASFEIPQELRNWALLAAVLYWVLGVLLYLGGDELIRRIPTSSRPIPKAD